MYIYYTMHKDGHGKLVLTELKLTSVYSKWQIYWKAPLEDALFKIINPLLKMPPISIYSYDPQLKIWSYMDQWGADVLSKIKATTAPLGGVICVEVPDLAAIALDYIFDVSKIKQTIRPEDFFYQQAPVSTPALTKEQVAQKLLALGVTDKKSYRQAALKYHPDRNNGDGSQMSELNMLWQVYNA